VNKYDKFVLLTEEDKNNWKQYHHTISIPNARTFKYANRAKLENKKIIAIGRLTYQKGFDRLISTWNIIKEDIGDWELEIYGEGELRNSLQQQINELGVNNSIKLMGTSSQIKKIYENASLLVMSSRFEGFPMALVEGKSAGLPILSFDFPCGPKDIIQDKVDGYIVRNGDIQGLANRILQLIKDDKLRKKMGENAFINSDAFSEDKIMQRWINLFDSLLRLNNEGIGYSTCI
jgi:glycosyltransferase involved in cell wall biosynthesis